MATVYLVWFAGGLRGAYDNAEAAERVAKAQNDYYEKRWPMLAGRGRPPLLATVVPMDVQSEPAPEDLL